MTFEKRPEANEAKENAQPVRPPLFAREDDAARVESARTEAEQHGFTVTLVLLSHAHELLAEARRHTDAVERALSLVGADASIGCHAHRPLE